MVKFTLTLCVATLLLGSANAFFGNVGETLNNLGRTGSKHDDIVNFMVVSSLFNNEEQEQPTQEPELQTSDEKAARGEGEQITKSAETDTRAAPQNNGMSGVLDFMIMSEILDGGSGSSRQQSSSRGNSGRSRRRRRRSSSHSDSYYDSYGYYDSYSAPPPSSSRAPPPPSSSSSHHTRAPPPPSTSSHHHRGGRAPPRTVSGSSAHSTTPSTTSNTLSHHSRAPRTPSTMHSSGSHSPSSVHRPSGPSSGHTVGLQAHGSTHRAPSSGHSGHDAAAASSSQINAAATTTTTAKGKGRRKGIPDRLRGVGSMGNSNGQTTVTAATPIAVHGAGHSHLSTHSTTHSPSMQQGTSYRNNVRHQGPEDNTNYNQNNSQNSQVFGQQDEYVYGNDAYVYGDGDTYVYADDTHTTSNTNNNVNSNLFGAGAPAQDQYADYYAPEEDNNNIQPNDQYDTNYGDYYLYQENDTYQYSDVAAPVGSTTTHSPSQGGGLFGGLMGNPHDHWMRMFVDLPEHTPGQPVDFLHRSLWGGVMDVDSFLFGGFGGADHYVDNYSYQDNSGDSYLYLSSASGSSDSGD